MPSALLLFYTSEGFLVTADGRARAEGAVLSDTVTKIFSVSQPRMSLAYAFGGSVALTDKDNSEIILFDFRDEALKAIKSLRKDSHPDFLSYAKKLTKRLQNRLEKALENERIERLKNDGKGLVAALFIAGYYAKIPSAVVIQFKHEGQAILPPLIREPELVKGYAPLVTGIRILLELQRNGSSKL